MSKLVIVESPTKAKTIGQFLGKEYTVESSFGHIRDLPRSTLGVDVENHFVPKYLVPKDKKARVIDMKKAAAKADEVLFATDADREGEAISWHLAEVLGEDEKKIKRITFHEITKRAIEAALKHPRPLDMQLVNAQQARRILDRLVGYKLSPFLWRKVQKGLSAGRVQSAAVRLIVEREREIQNFHPEEYWTIDGIFGAAKKEFAAHLTERDGEKLEKFSLPTETDAAKIIATLTNAKFVVANQEEKTSNRSANAPFTTSTLQQEANRRLNLTAKQTMSLAQELYERGFITYMRTDSVNLSPDFQQEAAVHITAAFGARYSHPQMYKTKSKNAQEAHEAIHPTEAALTPDKFRLQSKEARLNKIYELIWCRALASQMAAAELQHHTIDLTTTGTDKIKYTFRANGQTIVFPGFLAVYPDQQKETELPKLTLGDAVASKDLTPTQHFTEPPARFSDATLVKALEEYDIGRPSTYAPTIATVIGRGYVERDDKKRLAPTAIAFTVIDLLTEHFPDIVDYKFTADMENDLDEIANGNKKMEPVLEAFYTPFAKNLAEKTETVEKMTTPDEPTDQVCENCGKPMVIKMGRFGKFLACTGYPECKTTKPIQNKIGMTCPTCQVGEIVQKKSHRGKIFFACNRYPDCKTAYWYKPTAEKCATCGAVMVQAPRALKCSNKDCATNTRKKKKTETEE